MAPLDICTSTGTCCNNPFKTLLDEQSKINNKTATKGKYSPDLILYETLSSFPDSALQRHPCTTRTHYTHSQELPKPRSTTRARHSHTPRAARSVNTVRCHIITIFAVRPTRFDRRFRAFVPSLPPATRELYPTKRQINTRFNVLYHHDLCTTASPPSLIPPRFTFVPIYINIYIDHCVMYEYSPRYI